MGNKIYKLIIFFIVILVIALQQGRLLGREFPGTENDNEETVHLPEITLEQAKLIFSEAYSIRQTDTSAVEVFDNRNKKIGVVLLSSPFTDKIVGFGGTIPLLIGISNDNKIANITVLENRETKEYFNQVINSGLLSQWIGLDKEEAMTKNVDAVSGATFTSNAIIKTFQNRISADARSTSKNTFQWNIRLKNAIVILILLLALYCFFRPRATQKIRLPLLALSVIVLGFWQGSMLSLSQFVSWLTNGVPLSVQFGLFAVFLFSFLLPIFTGKAFYCSYVCPFGAAQELVGKVRFKKIKMTQKMLQWLLVVRKAFLVAIILLLCFGVNFNLSYVEPFTVFNISIASVVTIAIAVLSLILSLFISRPWCRFLCPTGQILDLLRK